MNESILSVKSYAFALRIIRLYQFMVDDRREFVLSKQVLRSGTSIGANVEESIHAQSKTDFVHKLSIAQKEAIETNYWLRLLKDSGYIEKNLAESLLSDCDELQRMLAASIKTAKSNLRKAAGGSQL
ncbi:MAG: four helix bundle protein [Pyrinomonadaceae bacterium]